MTDGYKPLYRGLWGVWLHERGLDVYHPLGSLGFQPYLDWEPEYLSQPAAPQAPFHKYSIISSGIISLIFILGLFGSILDLWAIPPLVPGPMGSDSGMVPVVAWASGWTNH